MCAILYASFDLSDEEIQSSEYNAIRRGPDYKSVERIGGDTFVQYLLHITGKKTPQPLISKDSILIYNGEIYNHEYFGSYDSDGFSILDAFNSRGVAGLRLLDGEFSGVLKKGDQLFIFRDTFGTKPLFVAEDTRGVAVASYISQLKSLGFTKIGRAPVNCIVDRDLKKNQSSQNVFREFDLKQHKKTFDDWENAFNESVKKRTLNTQVKYFIGLSSGYDSGLISHTLNKLKRKYNSYSVLADEHKETLHKRGKLSPNHKLIKVSADQFKQQRLFIQNSCEEFTKKWARCPRRTYSVHGDKGSIGTGIICEEAQKDDCKVYLSGQGADETISDYGYNGAGPFYSTIGGLFSKDLKLIFPWENIFNGTQEKFLMKDENVGGTYGIECRYPFLDFNLVQEFLWLDHNLKNQNYKSPIFHVLTKYGYPLAPNGFQGKVGFRANKF